MTDTSETSQPSPADAAPGAEAPQWAIIARLMSKWLLEWQPQVRPMSWQSWATRTEPSIVQKCGSARGMLTEPRAREWVICRQSVATMLVAVGSPVARRNSARISRPE